MSKREDAHCAAVVGFLRTAGLKAEAGDGHVKVGGASRSLPRPVGSNKSETIDRFVAKALKGDLVRAVDKYLGRVGVTKKPTKLGVQLHRGGKPVALVSATRASLLPKGAVVRGNFLRSGDHWTKFREALRDSQTSPRPPSPKGQPPKIVVLTDFPAPVRAEERTSAAVCARRIREDRTVAFPAPVRLTNADESLTLMPVTEENPVEAPFEYSRGGPVVTAALRLKAPGKLLALVVPPGGDAQTTTRAWIRALQGLAELTCLEAPGGTAEDWWGPAVSPTPATRRLLPSWVVGHRRRYRERQPSETSRRNAQRIGIRLAPNESWVQPYLKGQGRPCTLEFRWQPPTS